MAAFDYPPDSQPIRHGPEGDRNYLSYRPWLRDEFDFRSAYCLIREQWGRVTGEFDVEHFVPQKRSPELAVKYDNLLYACHSCNIIKGEQHVPDPRMELIATQIQVRADGTVIGMTPEAERLIKVVGLNAESYRKWRLTWIRIIELAEQYDRDLYRRLMSFPDDLPDLARSRPPANLRPDGIRASYFARRAELPETY